MELYYALNLWDPATPSFCSFSKPYIGTELALQSVVKAMDKEEPGCETAMAIQAYFAGDKAATHSIAYQQIPVLEPVQVLACSEMSLPAKVWDHYNTWGFPYVMKCSAAEVQQILVPYEGRYHRFVKALISDLCYRSVDSKWRPAGASFWGNVGVLRGSVLDDGHRTLQNVLYVQEDTSEDMESLLQKMKDPEAVIMDKFCDEIFGDG